MARILPALQASCTFGAFGELTIRVKVTVLALTEHDIVIKYLMAAAQQAKSGRR